VPATWAQGVEYVKTTSVAAGDLVVVDGPSGLFFATVEKKTGFPWQQQYSLVVQVMTDGSPATRETADLASFYTPTPEALEALNAPAASAIGGFFKNLFGGAKEAAPPPPPPKPAAPAAGTRFADLLPKEAGTLLFDLQKKVSGDAPAPPPAKAPAPPLRS